MEADIETCLENDVSTPKPTWRRSLFFLPLKHTRIPRGTFPQSVQTRDVQNHFAPETLLRASKMENNDWRFKLFLARFDRILVTERWSHSKGHFVFELHKAASNQHLCFRLLKLAPNGMNEYIFTTCVKVKMNYW